MSGLSNIIPNESLVERKRSNFTRSLDLGEVHSIDHGAVSDIFSQSVHLPNEPLQNLSDNAEKGPGRYNQKKGLKLSIKDYFKWIGGRKPITEQRTSLSDSLTIKYVENKTSVSCPALICEEDVNDKPCSCSKFHHHTFKSGTFYIPKEIDENPEAAFSTKIEFVEANRRHLILCNTFWNPALSLNQENYASRQGIDKKLISFESLWPDRLSLRSLLKDGILNTGLRDAISELALLAAVCGPVHLLESMIQLSLIRLDCHLEDGQGLLHYACLMQRAKLVSFLTKFGILAELPDRRGYTADEVCFSPEVWRNLPSKYHVNTMACPSNETMIMPTLHDKSVLFRMAQMTGNIYELQMNLQMLNFNVNTECNTDGDFLIHVAVRGGICQLPLIMTLVKIQKADIELCNSKGMSPLMIAAQAGNRIMCDVLICVLGADPNKVNVVNGRSALHYAAQNCHEDCVSCLIKRGADINHEDYIGCLPDDLQMVDSDSSSDCKDVIQSRRKQRLDLLKDKVINGQITQSDLVESDLCCVDEDGFTLIMLAAVENRLDNLNQLLMCSVKSLDAQIGLKTNEKLTIGMTALAMAARLGHTDAVHILMSREANPGISDIDGLIPLHHAVKENQHNVVEVILQFFPKGYTGLHTAKSLCSDTELIDKLNAAWLRRQEEIVSPALQAYSMEGNADQLYCLLEEGDLVDIQSAFGSWPLFIAIQNDFVQIVQLLCEKGADIRKRHSATGNTILHLAASLGRQQIVQYLLTSHKIQYNVDLGEDFRFSTKSLNINATNNVCKTALQLAGEKGFLRVVKCLLSHGATTSVLDPSGNLFTVPEYEGVWREILSYRQQHTNLVMRLIEDIGKEKKDFRSNFEKLSDIWVPCFDHNLRDHLGNTPLMKACRIGNIDTLLFLLQSAVYNNNVGQDEDLMESCSDNDSGVLDTDSVKTDHYEGIGQKYGTEKRDQREEASRNLKVEGLLEDISKPSGLSINHDGLVNHVCAVNTLDKCTSYHYCVERGDNLDILELLLKVDPNDMTVNMRNSSGLTPLHLACQLNRKKCVQRLLECPGIDLNILTLDCHLPEEMTRNKQIKRIIQKKKSCDTKRSFLRYDSRSSSVTNLSGETQPYQSEIQSTINIDKIASKFDEMKKNVRQNTLNN